MINLDNLPDWQEFDREHLWHPYALMPAAVPPLGVRRAKDCTLELDDGRELIDGMASWWCMLHGYNPAPIVEALSHQIKDLSHVMFGGLTHGPAVALGQRLCQLAPPGLDRIFFSDSGSVAVEVALKMALQYWQGAGRPQRQRFLTVRGGYHGDTFGAMSVCDPETGMHTLFNGVLPRHLFASRPAPAFGAPWQPQAMDEIASMLDAHADELAAVIIEPVVQGAGGMWFYHPQYLVALRALCERYQVLLIFDEIATGFGRTGKLFAAEHAGVRPDIMCIGKALTGGTISLAATLTTGEIAAAVSADGTTPLMHGPTFMANPLACAAAVASIDMLLAGDWQQQVSRIESQLNDALATCRDRRGVRDIRVLGAIGVIELEQPCEMTRVRETCLDHGVWLRPFGRLLYTMPPYVITPAELARVTGAMIAITEQQPTK